MAITYQQEHTNCQHWQPESVKIINDRAIKFRDVTVHEFTLGDVADPDLYASEPLWQWEQSECGKWCMEHAVEAPYWVRHPSISTYGYKYLVVARLSEQNEIYFRLKFK
jgi:hypothetical protein